jgi:hypothetical protein
MAVIEGCKLNNLILELFKEEAQNMIKSIVNL